MSSLPKPDVVRCFFDESVEPHLSAMVLRWDADSPGLNENVWRLPDNVVLRGAPPERFGITVERRGPTQCPQVGEGTHGPQNGRVVSPPHD